MRKNETQVTGKNNQLFDAALHLYIAKLERENAETKGWIEQPNNLISVVAIVISLMSVAYGFVKDYYDGIDKDLQSLSTTVSDLTKLDSDMLTASLSDASRLSDLQLILNNRRISLLAEADRLIASLGPRAPRVQLAILGPEYYQIGDFAKATKYFLLLTDRSEPPAMRFDAWRSLAVTYIGEGRDFYPKAEEAFQNAVQIFSDPKDINSLTLVVGAYEQWAQFELSISKYQVALDQFQRARNFAAQLPCPTLRPQTVARIVGEIQQATATFQSKDPKNAALTAPIPAAVASDDSC
jgi:tetratricopeptide (TPR) repeat protein